MTEAHAEEKKKLLENFAAEKQKLLEEHQLELDEKEQSIFEALQAAQEAKRTLRLAERDHLEAKKSLELTGANVKEMEAQQESWTNLLRLLDGELARKSILSPDASVAFRPSAHTNFLSSVVQVVSLLE